MVLLPTVYDILHPPPLREGHIYQCWQWVGELVVIEYMHIYFISIIKEKKLKKEGRGDIHQEVMNAWRRIYYMLASDYDILSTDQ